MIDFIPYFGGELATAATAGQIAIDGDGDQRREVAGSKRTIRRPEEAEQVTRGRRGSENFPKFGLLVYITRPYRCDRVERLDGTEMQNCKLLLQLGVTERF